MIKYLLSCRGGWSEKLQLIDNQVTERQEKMRELELVFESMTDNEIDEYEASALKMKTILESVKERVEN